MYFCVFSLDVARLGELPAESSLLLNQASKSYCFCYAICTNLCA